MKFIRWLLPCSILVFGMTGCGASDYVNMGVSSVTESLPMSQPDTANQLNSICNDVITTSAMLEQNLVKYTEILVDSTEADKEVLIQTIIQNIEEIEKEKAEIQSMNPAQALVQRADSIEKVLDDAETHLRDLQAAVDSDDFDAIEVNYSAWSADINNLKTLSTGM